MKTFLTFILSLLVTKQVFVNVTSILNKIADLTKCREIFTKIPIKQTLERTVRDIYSHITGYFYSGYAVPTTREIVNIQRYDAIKRFL